GRGVFPAPPKTHREDGLGQRTRTLPPSHRLPAAPVHEPAPSQPPTTVNPLSTTSRRAPRQAIFLVSPEEFAASMAAERQKWTRSPTRGEDQLNGAKEYSN